MLRRISMLIIISVLLLSVSILGCSGGSSPVVPGTPDTTGIRTADSGSTGHVLWGMVNVTIDPDTLQAEVVPLRGPMFTANVTQFMQPPISPTNMIKLAIDPSTDFATGYIVVDVTLQHPFPGLNFYNGFDVRGIFMSDGSVNLDHDPSALYAATGDSMLLNADGYTRWWNWSEFTPHNTIFGATYGKLAPPNQPTGTLNGYKYFADCLEFDDPATAIDPATRGAFTSFSSNSRRYEIQFKMDGVDIVFDFNYAVDASWSDPDPAYDPDYPSEAFPLSANSAEAYLIAVADAGSTAWYIDDTNKGGSLLLDIEIYDWQASANPSGVLGELAGLWLEGEVVSAPVNLLSGAVVSDGGDTSSVFQVEISTLDLKHSGLNEIWIIAENADPNTYEPNLDIDTSPWTWTESPLAAYLRSVVMISGDEPPPVVTAIDPIEGDKDTIVNATVTGDYFIDGCQVELRESGGTFVVQADNESWVDKTEVTCDLDLAGANLGLYDVVVINPSTLEGQLDEGFEVLESNVIYVDDSNTSGTEDGTMTYPYNTIQEGLAAALADWEVRVDDSGVDYTGPVTLAAGVYLKSVNWDDSDGDDEAIISLSGTATVVNGAEGATIDGFQISGSSRTGMFINGVSTTVKNCHITLIHCSTNYATFYGIRVANSPDTIIENCEVSDIRSSNSYVVCYAVHLLNSPVTMTDTDIHYIRDTGGYWGSAVVQASGCNPVGDSKLEISHCSIYDFSTGSYTTEYGLYIHTSDEAEVYNNLIYDITGGSRHTLCGVRVHGSTDVEFVNNVIYDIYHNSYYNSGYGLFISSCTNLDVRNTIINYIHCAGIFSSSYGVYMDSASTCTFEYNDVHNCGNGLYSGSAGAGTGCISANPSYVNPGTDFNLQSGSPCIDMGDPDSAYDDPDGSRNDMGAYGGPGGDW